MEVKEENLALFNTDLKTACKLTKSLKSHSICSIPFKLVAFVLESEMTAYPFL